MKRHFVALLALPALLATTRIETAARLGGTPAEPVFDPSQSQMLFQQNFDRYTTDSLRPRCGTSPASTPKRVVDNAVQHCTPGAGWTYDANVSIGAGHSGNAVTIHYDGPYQETHGVVVGYGGSTGKSVTVIQYWAKWTPDAGFTLDGNSIIQIKNIMLWNDISRFEAMTHAHAGGCPISEPSATMLGQYDQGDSQCNADQPVGPYFATYANGQWHRWTIAYKPNTAQGSRDGMMRLWIDGTVVLRVEKSAIGVTPPGGFKPWCLGVDVDNLYSGNFGVSALQWGANRTDGSKIPFTLAIDDVKWWVAKS